jgi:eukaryotic-like serine/threonine-protein kinase
MSPTAPAGDPASRPEKIATFVSRSDPRATAVVDDLNAFSSERSLPTETRSLERASPGTLHRPASEPAPSRWPLLVSVGAGVIALIVSGIFIGPRLFNLSESGGPALKPGRVTIGTTPLGAMVIVDGVSRGLTPVTLQLDPGTHTVVLQRGSVERTMPIQVASGAEMTQHYEFAAEPASTSSSVHVTTDPAGARVIVDGELRGVSPLSVTGLSAANHKITIVGEGGTVERQIVTEAGVASSLVVSLPRAGAVSAGWLSISAPFEVQVVERGDVIGSSASPRFMIRAGAHEMELVNETLGYSERRKVEVNPGGTATIKIDARSSLSINARPWAEITLDGKPVGQTPIANLNVSLGAHQLVFRHPDLGERQQTVTVTAKAPNRVAVDLTR